MPYPTLLQRAAGFSARSADRYSLVQSDFPREFAEFIDFVGAHALDKEIRKIEQRFGAGVTAANLALVRSTAIDIFSKNNALGSLTISQLLGLIFLTQQRCARPR